MRSTRLLILIAALSVAGPAAAQGWFGYTSETDQFTVNFPDEPQIEEITWPSEYGAEFPGRVYTAKRGDAVYSVTVVDYRDSQNIHLARSNSTEADSAQNYSYWIIDIVASVDYAAQVYRKRGGAVTFDAWAHIDRVPGHQLQITGDDGSRSYIGIFMHERRLYIADATVPAGAPPQGHFQQSLGFVDAAGERVRYDWDEDFNLIRSRGAGTGPFGGVDE
ncbi:MAG: hypothetical protein ACR2QQ_02850 [Gammaproteobacteria bacterium]